MKKIVMSIAIVALISSCKKKEVKETSPCNCGIVQSDNAMDYSVVIKNECTDNNKTFTLSSCAFTSEKLKAKLAHIITETMPGLRKI
jgi:hypothetical protein